MNRRNEGLAVLEQFLSIQGEGEFQGRCAYFYRLAGCNIPGGCIFCDTSYAQSKNVELQVAQMPPSQVKLIVITGGEPLWDTNRDKTEQLIVMGCQANCHIQIETNGMMPPLGVTWSGLCTYVVSPKLKNAGNNLIRMNVLEQYVDKRASFKFVISTEEDIKDVHKIVEDLGIEANRVWLMPEGVEVAEILEKGKLLLNEVLLHGYNYSCRLHRLLNCV